MSGEGAGDVINDNIYDVPGDTEIIGDLDF